MSTTHFRNIRKTDRTARNLQVFRQKQVSNANNNCLSIYSAKYLIRFLGQDTQITGKWILPPKTAPPVTDRRDHYQRHAARWQNARSYISSRFIYPDLPSEPKVNPNEAIYTFLDAHRSPGRGESEASELGSNAAPNACSHRSFAPNIATGATNHGLPSGSRPAR